MKPKNHMVLTTFMLPAGYHKDSWRMEGSRAEELGNLDFVADLTAMAEAAKLDAVFFGDIVHANTVMRGDIKMNGFYEPMTVLAALAARTKNIGLIGTMSTSFSEPYNLARQLCGLDHMSNGRAGWNIVTSSDGFSNYGVEDVPTPPCVTGGPPSSWTLCSGSGTAGPMTPSSWTGPPASTWTGASSRPSSTRASSLRSRAHQHAPVTPGASAPGPGGILGPGHGPGLLRGRRHLHRPAVQGTVHRVLHQVQEHGGGERPEPRRRQNHPGHPADSRRHREGSAGPRQRAGRLRAPRQRPQAGGRRPQDGPLRAGVR